jgi:hypothetical protein
MIKIKKRDILIQSVASDINISSLGESGEISLNTWIIGL